MREGNGGSHDTFFRPSPKRTRVHLSPSYIGVRECLDDRKQYSRRIRGSQDPRRILGRNAEPTGTDGIRVLCHQFFPSSLLRRESCLTSSKTFWLKMNKLREALLLLYIIGGQGRKTRQMGYPLPNSRLCCTVCLRRKNLCATLQMILASHMKRSGVWFVLLVAAQRPL